MCGPQTLSVEHPVGSRSGPYEFGNLGFQAIGGVQLHVSRRWDVFAEYKRTYTEANGSIEGGSSRTELHSNHFTLGGGAHF